MNKKTPFIIVCWLLIYALNTHAGNSIIAIVNDDLILTDVLRNLEPNASKAQKLAAIYHQIDLTLQFQQIYKIGIKPKNNAVNNKLNAIAVENKITLAELKKVANFADINNYVRNQLMLSGLKQFTLRNAKITLLESEINQVTEGNLALSKNFRLKLLKQKQETYFKNWLLNLRKNAYIEIYKHKL